MALTWVQTTTVYSDEALMAEFSVSVERRRGPKDGRRGPLRGSSPGHFTVYVERDPVIMAYTGKQFTVRKSRNWTWRIVGRKGMVAGVQCHCGYVRYPRYSLETAKVAATSEVEYMLAHGGCVSQNACPALEG